MSQTAAVSKSSEPRSLGSWQFWLANAVFAPIAASLSLWLVSSGGQDWQSGVLVTAAVFAVIYALVARAWELEPVAAVGGYLLATVLTVPWGYGLLIGALVVSGETGSTCLS
ncbi:MAG TPA: hypothetical protein VFY44_09860 [Thermoleophilaceae bacterium]|nr:hypothetical protein [Thermoleophilaceae bacterium]